MGFHINLLFGYSQGVLLSKILEPMYCDVKQSK